MAKTEKFGLSSFALKIIALIFMTVDHIGYLCRDIPIIAANYTLLRTLGRIGAPLFLFCLVQGCMHSRSLPRYALRLYIAGVLAGLFHTAMNMLFGDKLGIHSFGIIFFTFAYVVLYVMLIENLAAAVKSRQPLRVILFVIVGIAAFCIQYLRDPLCDRLVSLTGDLTLSASLADGLCPSRLEYGWGFVILGVVMYLARDKYRQILVFAVFSAICYAGAHFFGIGYSLFPKLFTTHFALGFFNSIQKYQFISIPFMLLYNGKRGRSMKYLFYIYYPTHLYVLLLINLIFGK